jgi:hypothetical protein
MYPPQKLATYINSGALSKTCWLVTDGVFDGPRVGSFVGAGETVGWTLTANRSSLGGHS